MLHRLSGDPGRTLRERVRHHGARTLLIAGLSVMVALLFPPAEGMGVQPYEVGMVAPADVIAEVPFSVPKSAAELERDRAVAMDAVPPTFDFRAETGDSVAARLVGFFDRLDSAAIAEDDDQLAAILQESQISATPSQMEYVADDASRAAFREAAVGAAREIIPLGVADGARLTELTTGSLTVRRGEVEETTLPQNVLTARQFFDEAVLFLPPDLPPEARDLFRLMLIFHLEYSLVSNVVESERDRDAAARSVPTTKAEVLQGQAIVRAADPIGPETLERLQAYEDELTALGLLEQRDRAVGSLIGAGLLNLILFSIFGLFVFFNRPAVYANFRWLILLALLAAAYFGAGVAIDRGGFSPEWLPIAFVALPVAVLWDTRMSLFLVLILAAVSGTLEPFSHYGTVLALMAGGAAAAMSVRALRRRSETWVSIAIIAGASAAVLMTHGVATGRPFAEVLSGSAFFAGNATVSALLAMGFLLVFEAFTGITTDQTLLEWADPTRPLLRQLSMEAPGTYAHTINVANLAEAAATGIGANGLLCRVGVLYHDVGKMLKPHYFVENQPDGRNPHDKLKPETSAAIVREHVTEGARLAREAKVPQAVFQFILEHHGTQRIGFFYEKAREESEDDVDASRFSYPGPKPQSRESAIVMLADSCESATRAMQEPTSERVRDLIDTIVSGKIADGQLDESPLTLAEIAEVKEEFVTILGGVTHRRIEYPSTKHLTDAEGAGVGEALETGEASTTPPR